MSEEKQTFGDPLINDCMAYITATLGYPPVGGSQSNRRYCKHLLNIMTKAYPSDPPEVRLKLLIKHGSSGWYSRQMDGFQWLYYNYGKVINEVRAKQAARQPQKSVQSGGGPTIVTASVDDRN